MARGTSGRIVIEVSPDLKRQLYIALAIENQTLKDWFVEAAGDYLGAKTDKNVQEENSAKLPLKEKL